LCPPQPDALCMPVVQLTPDLKKKNDLIFGIDKTPKTEVIGHNNGTFSYGQVYWSYVLTEWLL